LMFKVASPARALPAALCYLDPNSWEDVKRGFSKRMIAAGKRVGGWGESKPRSCQDRGLNDGNSVRKVDKTLHFLVEEEE